MRLPASSVLRVEASAGKCIVTETLAGRGQAINALVFSAFVLAVMIWRAFDTPELSGFSIGLLVVLAHAIVGLSFLVVRNTWRKTIIAIDNGEFLMTSTAPFTSPRRYLWQSADIAGVQLVSTDLAPAEESDSLAELRVYPRTGPEVHLFTDHALLQLRPIAAAMVQALAGDEPPNCGAGFQPAPHAG